MASSVSWVATSSATSTTSSTFSGSVTSSISVSITKGLSYYIDNKRVNENKLEQDLLALLKGKESPTIVLRAEEGVPIEKAVKVMDIANRNRFKVILAVRPK